MLNVINFAAVFKAKEGTKKPRQSSSFVRAHSNLREVGSLLLFPLRQSTTRNTLSSVA